MYACAECYGPVATYVVFHIVFLDFHKSFEISSHFLGIIGLMNRHDVVVIPGSMNRRHDVAIPCPANQVPTQKVWQIPLRCLRVNGRILHFFFLLFFLLLLFILENVWGLKCIISFRRVGGLEPPPFILVWLDRRGEYTLRLESEYACMYGSSTSLRIGFQHG